jgi:hypothetical protein
VLYYVTALRMIRPRLYEALEKLPVFDHHVTVNFYDIMFVVAQRR